MRTTREKLIRLCETYIQQRAAKDRSIVCVFLTGSILKEFPFINGTTDVDMIMIHSNLSTFSREVVPVNDEATLDIYHYPKEYFANTRNLRFDPWLGSALCFDPIVLFGKGHWFEFILSSTEATFCDPEVVLKRVQFFNKEAQRSYFSLKNMKNPTQLNTRLELYLKCVSDSMNALSCVTGRPLTIRRAFQDFPEVCEPYQEKFLPDKAEALITGKMDLSPYFEYFTKSWTYYMDYFSQYTSPGFYSEYGPFRMPYYVTTVEGLWESHRPSAIWIMLNTWCEINKAMKMENSEPFNSFLNALEINTQTHNDRMVQMNGFLELIGDTLDEWASSKGIGEATDIYTEL